MRYRLAIAVLLVMAVAAAFWPLGGYAFVDYDDPGYVYENLHVQAGLSWSGVAWAFTATHQANWHPLTWLSHMLDCQLFGLWAGGHHLVNVALHAANSVLIFLVLRRMTARQWPSAVVAALFALHPLHVESVAWVAERKDVLSTFLGLLALLSYAWYAARPSVGRYLPVFVLLALGLMAKPMLVTLPFVMLLLDWWPLGRLTAVQSDGCVPRLASRFLRVVLEKAPLFVLAAASSMVTFIAQERGGAVVSTDFCTPSLRAVNVLVAYAVYLGKAMWPTHLAVFYPYLVQRPLWQPVAAGVLLAAITAGVILAARRRPYLAVGWFWYLGTLVPVIGLVQVGKQAMADRYTYAPLVGLFLAAVWGLADVLAGWRHRLRVLAPLAAAVLAACMMLTVRQVRFWSDTEALFRHAIDVVPASAIAHCNLGTALMAQGRLDEAVFHLREAVRILPGYSMAHDSLGVALTEQGQWDEAMRCFRTAIRLEPERALPRSNLAGALLHLGRPAEAIQHLREAVRLDPDLPDAHYNLAVASVAEGRPQEAIAHAREALRLKPGWAAPYSTWGVALMAEGRLEEAAAQFRTALGLKPDFAEALDNLGGCVLRQGRPDEAAAHFREAIRAQPRFVRAYANLGGALHQAGRYEDAVAPLQEALRLDPDLAAAHVNLAAVLVALGRTRQAEAHAREALRREPGLAPAHYNLGAALAGEGRLDEAAGHLREAVRLQPDYAEALGHLGVCLARQGNTREAAGHLAEALRRKPDMAPAMDHLARIRAADPDAALRNGAEAVALAERACALTGRRDPECLDTLAAAYAEAGRFADAAAAAREASAMAAAQGRRDLAARINARRRQFEAGRPLRQGPEPPPAPPPPPGNGP
ncbi:MAG: tetratricopeptide repeat protein [Planctomycetes bacterium]|nr:tetratricopeptide repeat protein [Planctomycetota bacterium]